MGKVCILNEYNWEQEVLNSDVPVLVDFWAPWCGPCRIIAPIIEELAEELEGKVKVCKLNTDENPNIAMRYGIRAIPTLMIFKDGKPVETMVGVQPKEAIKEKLKQLLNARRNKMGKVCIVNENNWEEEVLNSDLPVLVDFWAPWCGPCRLIAPIIEELAEELEGKAKICKLNTDENPNIAMRYGIRAIPTIMVFKNGQVVDTRVGVQPKEVLKSLLV